MPPLPHDVTDFRTIQHGMIFGVYAKFDGYLFGEESLSLDDRPARTLDNAVQKMLAHINRARKMTPNERRASYESACRAVGAKPAPRMGAI